MDAAAARPKAAEAAGRARASAWAEAEAGDEEVEAEGTAEAEGLAAAALGGRERSLEVEKARLRQVKTELNAKARGIKLRQAQLCYSQVEWKRDMKMLAQVEGEGEGEGEATDQRRLHSVMRKVRVVLEKQVASLNDETSEVQEAFQVVKASEASLKAAAQGGRPRKLADLSAKDLAAETAQGDPLLRSTLQNLSHDMHQLLEHVRESSKPALPAAGAPYHRPLAHLPANSPGRPPRNNAWVEDTSHAQRLMHAHASWLRNFREEVNAPHSPLRAARK